MSQSPKPRGLGRGLSALLGDEEVVATVAPSPRGSPSGRSARRRPPLTLPIGHLKPGRMQPRTTFEDLDALVEFGEGVRPAAADPGAAGRRASPASTKSSPANGAGGRRSSAQLHEVPVVVRSMDDRDALQVGLIENLQRADLTAIDEAQAYRRLVEDFKQSHDEIARTVGKSRPHVANTVRLLELPGAGAGDGSQGPAVGGASPRAGRLARSAGHGRAGAAGAAHGARPRAHGRRSQGQAAAARGQAGAPPRAPTPARWRSASRRPWASRPSSSCAGWASRACSPWRSATSTSSMPSSTG